MKKAISVFSVLVLIAIMVLSTVSFASETIDANGSILPMYNATCPLYDNHNMIPTGIGKLYDANWNLLWDGQAYQCDCGHYIIIKDGHMSGQTIGYYYRGEAESMNSLTILRVNPSEIEYTPYNYLLGYEFY